MKKPRLITCYRLLLTVFILSLSGCNPYYLFEGYYLIHPSNDSNKCLGVALFTDEDDTGSTCYIYLNSNKTFAHRQEATYEGTPEDFQFTLSGDEKTYKCVLTEYEGDDFEETPSNKPYSEEIFDVEVTSDVEYGAADGFWTSYNAVRDDDYISIASDLLRKAFEDGKSHRSLLMDVYKPVDTGENPRPLLIMIHGGAFLIGDKASQEYVDWCTHFARMGYVAVSLNYRLGFTPNESLERIEYRAAQDANAAVRYLLHNNDTYNIDRENIFAAGTSAGAITALNLAYLNDDNRARSTGSMFLGLIKGEGGMSTINPDYTETFSIKAVGNMWGAVSNPDILSSSPQTAVISFHSVNDNIVPYGYGKVFSDLPLIGPHVYGSSVIDARLKANGACSEFHTYQAYRHSMHVDENGNRIHDKFNEIQECLTSFFSEQMIQHPVELKWSERAHKVSIVDDSNVRTCSWKVNGGVILEETDSWIKVLLFDDAGEHSVIASGVDSDGWSFREEIEVF